MINGKIRTFTKTFIIPPLDDVRLEVVNFFKKQSVELYDTGIQAQAERWRKVIDTYVDYIIA